MRHLCKAPQADQGSAIWVRVEDFQRREQGVPGIFNRSGRNLSVIAQGIRSRCNRLCDLQFYALPGSKGIDLQTVGELYFSIGFRKFIVARVECARLPVTGNIDIGKLWEEEVDFRSAPGSVDS